MCSVRLHFTLKYTQAFSSLSTAVAFIAFWVRALHLTLLVFMTSSAVLPMVALAFMFKCLARTLLDVHSSLTLLGLASFSLPTFGFSRGVYPFVYIVHDAFAQVGIVQFASFGYRM